MRVQAEHAKLIADIRQRILPYTQLGPSLSTLQARLNDNSFADLAPDVSRILDILALLKQCDLEQIPVTRLKEVLRIVGDTNNLLDAIKNYTTKNSSFPLPTVKQVQSQLERLYSEIVGHTLRANLLGEPSRKENAERFARGMAMIGKPKPIGGILSRWEQIRPLGSGGQGNVFLVVDTAADPLDLIVEPLKALVRDPNSKELIAESRRRLRDALSNYVDGKVKYGALKQLIKPDEQALLRLEAEARVYDQISDSNLLTILDKNVPEGWIVTEYQPSGILETKLAEFQGQVLKSLTAIRPIVSVLAKMHSQGFTHRDVKPGNVFLNSAGGLVLGDAGLVFHESSERASKTHENVGTRDYMPPWAQSRRSDIHPSFDVFAIGKVVHAMISGKPAPALWYIHKEYSELTTLFPNDHTMHWANELLDGCVVEEEEQIRFRTANELLQHIDLVTENLQGHRIPPGRVKEEKRKCRICGLGEYSALPRLHLGNDSAGKPLAIANECTECGHIEFFRSKTTQ